MLTVRIPDDLRDAIDAVRGDVPRERWIRRACEERAQRRALDPEARPAPIRPRGEAWDASWVPLSTREAGRCLTCGKANGVHKGDCPNHPRSQ